MGDQGEGVLRTVRTGGCGQGGRCVDFRFQRSLAEGEHGVQELSGGELDGVWLGGDVPITSWG